MGINKNKIINKWCQNNIQRYVGNKENPNIFILARFADLETFIKYLILEDINKEDGEYGLLHYALAGKNFETALFLIDQNIDVNMRDSNGQTALHYISEKQVVFEEQNLNVFVAEKLLEHGADINIKDKYGNSAFRTAVFNCKGRNYEMVDLFMKYNPDILTKNNFGNSPLDTATKFGDEKLINILLKK